ncbi:MAG: hypothetical protein JNL97_02770 [Verrucomicrobiales bacterium]|nr:hypothetical protein [Verrucomicrobiales bacterium]
MKRQPSLPAALRVVVLVPVLGLGSLPSTQAAPTSASDIAGYTPGTGAANGYQRPESALGEPSRLTPGEFGGPVDPFSAPWQSGQLVSVGAGGSLTVRFAYPVLDLQGNPYGLDFLVFGSAAFLITNGDYTGGGITDGSLFGAATGPTRVSVSQDGLQFYTLDPGRTPTVDGFFPTDGAGDFSIPVPPSLAASDFADRGLDGIRALYAGSGGGTGFDIGWARDNDGAPVALDSVQFVRIDVLGDRAEIDGFSAVPEPGPLALGALGAGIATLLRARRDRTSEARARTH